jgi:hypothetical protein
LGDCRHQSASYRLNQGARNGEGPQTAGEPTFAGTRGNDEVAPISAVRGTTMQPQGTILKRHPWPHHWIFGLAKSGHPRQTTRHADARLTSTRRVAPSLLSDRRYRSPR